MNIRPPTFKESILVILILLVVVLGFTSFKINNNNEILRKELADRHDSTTTVLMQRIDLLQAGISRDLTRKHQIDGVQKYIASVNKRLKYDRRFSIATTIVNTAEIYPNVSVSLLTSVIKRESHFNNSLVSPAGAVGLMGIMEDTGEWGCEKLGIYYLKKLLKNPEINIRIGTWYLSHLIDKYNSETLALAHYNGGYRQKNRYLHNRRYKNKPDFKQSKETIQTKVETLRDSLVASGVGKGYLYENKEYAYLMKLLSAKKFAPETKHYIPAVLNEKEHIELFINENARLANKTDSTDAS